MVNEVLEQKWNHFFRLIDVNKDGVWSIEDATDLSLRVARVWGIESNGRLFERIEKSFLARFKSVVSKIKDREKGTAITKNEWLNFCENFLMEDRHTLSEFISIESDFIIELFDIDENGCLDQNEFIAFLDCFDIEENEAVQCFRILDQKSNGHLRKDEIKTAMVKFFSNGIAKERSNFIFGIWLNTETINTTLSAL